MPAKSGVRRAAKDPARDLTTALRSCLERFLRERRSAGASADFELTNERGARLAVAFSGGRDSTALADVARRLRRAEPDLISGLMLIHVNHGLSERADEWARHAEAMARRWDLPLVTREVFVSRHSSLGLEAAAREARYRALARAAAENGCEAVLLAHHRDDRLEGFLIQWSRGAGCEGLAGMDWSRPLGRAPRNGAALTALRPWLSVSRADIDAYLRRARLSYVDDDSNDDTRILRNLLRHQLLPLLDQARPGWREAAARGLDLLRESADILNSLALEDLARCRDVEGALSAAALLDLPGPRQALCLRVWLELQGIRIPSQARLTETLRQIADTRGSGRLRLRFGEFELTGRRGLLRAQQAPRSAPVSLAGLECPLAWRGESELSVPPWRGRFLFAPCDADEPGISADALRAGPLTVRPRRGGEKIKLWPLRPSRNLKQHYQAQGIGEDERRALPLLWLGDDLLHAAGLGTESRLLVDPDACPERVKISWVADGDLLER